MSKKKALGRGLSALLSDSPTDEKLEVDNFPVGNRLRHHLSCMLP